MQTETHSDLEAQILYKICILCESVPRVVWMGSLTGEERFGLRCNCYPKAPVLGKLDLSREGKERKRMGELTQRALAVHPDRNPLTTEEIAKYISPNVTDAEAYIFQKFCLAQDLNPFVGEVYAIKYDKTSKMAIVVGIQALLKRAGRHTQYQGYQAGVVVVQDGKRKELPGSLLLGDEELVGGWCEVRRGDWAAPLHVVVSLSEYGKGQSVWKTMPGTMIEKVAITQAHRRAFPEQIGALFEDASLAEANISVEVSENPAQEAQAISAPPVEELAELLGQPPDKPRYDRRAAQAAVVKPPTKPAPDPSPSPAPEEASSSPTAEPPDLPDRLTASTWLSYASRQGWTGLQINGWLGMSADQYLKINKSKTYRDVAILCYQMSRE